MKIVGDIFSKNLNYLFFQNANITLWNSDVRVLKSFCCYFLQFVCTNLHFGVYVLSNEPNCCCVLLRKKLVVCLMHKFSEFPSSS